MTSLYIIPKRFISINLNVAIYDIRGGFFKKGGSTVYYQKYIPLDKVTVAGKLKHTCVFIEGALTMSVTKCSNLFEAVDIVNSFLKKGSSND